MRTTQSVRLWLDDIRPAPSMVSSRWFGERGDLTRGESDSLSHADGSVLASIRPFTRERRGWPGAATLARPESDSQDQLFDAASMLFDRCPIVIRFGYASSGLGSRTLSTPSSIIRLDAVSIQTLRKRDERTIWARPSGGPG
jgi:hypothetical protein